MTTDNNTPPKDWDSTFAKLVAAEAERDALRRALRNVLDMVASGVPDLETVIAARAALAGASQEPTR